ncbi:MAG: DNA polymerase III subunit beta [Flammeovirgaceae bacterium]|jgi:DNA polymerase-3 subunit beta|nr:DNA polymerase III subunit beta [Flammeovirgaceae bacterium]MEC7245267.1 DNA polymerase III subunit beta [Bacteroidota bacterium]MEC7851426.1 DNA polymerase III subunit beta [Bacteroidota bacterium]MEC8678881.1 DNA polymerase III subunit beta [Bacteroidota bacterium]MEC8702113.1 DNA polymerase III subunit beta [Bacteroidota bacterium]|tara:strand:- start:20816 stop:21946 length:1131 start_codon:yes stop_codon:yes gene_type:complete
MNFIVSSSYLLKNLNSISGVITSNPVVPILENVLFEIEGGNLLITASDLQTSVMVELQVESKEDGSVAIPAKILIETLKNLPEQPVTFSIDDQNYNIEINSDNGRYKLAGENSADFPKVPGVNDGYSSDINSEILNSAISNTIFSTSTDELRPAMTGVFFKLSSTGCTFVSTDGHRLVKYIRTDIKGDEVDHDMILPRKSLNLLKSILPTDKSSDIKLDFNASNAYFSFENIKMVCRLIDERYPDYDNVIPSDNSNTVTITKSELLGSLKRISIYANKTTNQVRFKITGSEILISAEDLDFSNEANERISCEHDGDDIEIGFNAKFLIEMLSNIESEKVILKLSEPNRAGLLIPEDINDNEDITMLVMPVMLNDNA